LFIKFANYMFLKVKVSPEAKRKVEKLVEEN